MTELATPAGYHSFTVASSSAGHVLGRYGDRYYTEGWFLWSPTTRQVSLVTGTADPGTGFSIQLSEAFAVNSSGQVVGTASIYTPGASPAPGLFVWTLTGGAKAYAFPTSNGGLPTAISDAGQVVGYLYAPGYQTRAFSWKLASGFKDLGTLGGAGATAAAVNDLGQVAGSADTSASSHAFLYDKSMRDLGALGQDYSQAVSLNNRGVVIGYSYTAQGEVHAFLRDTRMRDLGTLGGAASYPTALNERNEVVGRSYLLDGHDTQAFLWTSAAGMRNLGAGTTWVKSEAAGINESGQVVVNAFPPDGSSRVVVFSTR